jgi:hypothetical protein
MYGKQLERQIIITKRPHCGKKETQQHCMINCTYKDFVIIRRRARVIQDIAALKLLQEYNKDHIQCHLIQTILRTS